MQIRQCGIYFDRYGSCCKTTSMIFNMWCCDTRLNFHPLPETVYGKYLGYFVLIISKTFPPISMLIFISKCAFKNHLRCSTKCVMPPSCSCSVILSGFWQGEIQLDLSYRTERNLINIQTDCAWSLIFPCAPQEKKEPFVSKASFMLGLCPLSVRMVASSANHPGRERKPQPAFAHSRHCLVDISGQAGAHPCSAEVWGSISAARSSRRLLGGVSKTRLEIWGCALRPSIFILPSEVAA